MPTASRASFPAASSSASRWPARWSPNRSILLLDEPLSALDPFLRIRVRAELKRFQRELGITFVHVTHSQEEAMALADLIVVMNNGRIEQGGTPRDDLQRAAHRVRRPLHRRPQRHADRRPHGHRAQPTSSPSRRRPGRRRRRRPSCATSNTRASPIVMSLETDDGARSGRASSRSGPSTSIRFAAGDKPSASAGSADDLHELAA